MDQGKELKSPKVSVIIPVYNTEAYLEEAVWSIMNQTLQDTEIIIIDDGSTDNSLSIMSKLALKDHRIICITQSNQGQSAARNVGLQKSKGEFVYFMDSDDVLTDKALESCYSSCIQKDLDFIFFDAIKIADKSEDCNYYNRQNQFADRIFGGVEILNIMLSKHLYRVPPWLHFIRRHFLIKENITFDTSLRIYEDQIFCARLYITAERVGYIPKFFFKRRMRVNSLMTQIYSIDKVKSYFKVADALLDLRKGLEYNRRNAINRIIYQMLSAAVYNAKSLEIHERFQLLMIILSHYPFYVSLKSYIVLLFPSTIRFKLMIKERI